MPSVGDDIAQLDRNDLEERLESTDWSSTDLSEALPQIVSSLHALERDEGINDLHRAFSEAILSQSRPRLVHSRAHRNRFSCVALSPCGRYVATGSEAPTDHYDEGGEISVWEIQSGRVLSAIYYIDFGVGWSDVEGCLQWSRDGQLLAAAFATNVVGTFAPFDGRGGPLMSAGITNGWGSPPAFTLSPDASKLCIACWGEENGLPGGIVSTDEGELYYDGDDRIEWFNGDSSEYEGIEPWKRLRWSDDGRIYGLNEGHGQAWSVDDDTLDMSYFTKAHKPAAYSPDGRWLAQNPAGLAIYDGATGMATTKIPMIVGGTEMVWSPIAEQQRVALVVGPGNQFNSDPGVHIFDDGELVATVHDEPIRQNSPWDFPDVSQFTFSPDGNRCALITAEDNAAVWTLEDGGAHIKNLAISPGVQGLLWGRDGLVGLGPNLIEFWDVQRGERFAHHDLTPPAGLTDPIPATDAWQSEFPRDLIFPIANSGSWRWVVALPNGRIIVDADLADSLDSKLIFSLQGGRLGWPLRWAQETDLVSVITDPEEIEDPLIRENWRPAGQLEEVDQSEAFETMILAEYKDDFALVRIVEETDLERVSAPTRSSDQYFCAEPLTEEEITAEALQEFLGKTVLYTESWRPRFINLAVITAVSDSGFSYFYRSPSGSSGSGTLPFDNLEWIGLARWTGKA